VVVATIVGAPLIVAVHLNGNSTLDVPARARAPLGHVQGPVAVDV